MSEPPKKGSVESAIMFWGEQVGPRLANSVDELLKDIYNMQIATGSKTTVMRAIPLKDGRVLRLWGKVS